MPTAPRVRTIPLEGATMEERREELVGETVEQAKRVARETRRLVSSEARLTAEQMKDAVAPARQSLQEGAAAAGLAVLGFGLLALPWLRTLARHPVITSLVGGAAVGFSVVLAANAVADFPPNLRRRVRELLRTDLETAVDEATAP